jgi:hypothetical protein
MVKLLVKIPFRSLLLATRHKTSARRVGPRMASSSLGRHSRTYVQTLAKHALVSVRVALNLTSQSRA